MKLILNPDYGLYKREGKPFCDSLQIAGTFNKRHADMLNTINKLTESTSGLSVEFTERNFSLSNYKDNSGKNNPRYLLTKDGFAIVTFGYTGKKAMEFKEFYIDRFNKMEEFIKSLLITRKESLRTYLSLSQIKAIELLQRTDIGVLEINANLAERKEVLTAKYRKMQLRLVG